MLFPNFPDLLFVFLSLSLTHTPFNFFQEKIEEIDDSNVSPANYAVMVRGLPIDVTKEEARSVACIHLLVGTYGIGPEDRTLFPSHCFKN